MKTLQLELGERSYPIHIGTGLLGQPQWIESHVAGSQVMIVSNETVAPLYMEQARRAFAGFDIHEVILPDGEEHKTLTVLNSIFDALLTNRFERRCTLVALGGGVIGDMTGFAAACYQRGVPFIQIPTTLLAQVDSSVGGKTGVNHPHGKNMIGAFHQPRCVVIDTDTLNTLDDRQLSAGIAEIIKYGLIRDLNFLEWLEDNMDALMSRQSDALIYAIERSCQNKAEVVAADEKESGQRALLNLGHTFGHAIEAATGYGTWLHGEAVGIGMLMAADLSQRMGWLKEADVHRVENIIDKAALPTRAPAKMGFEKFMEYMSVDKKVMAGKLRLVLLESIGKGIVSSEFDMNKLQQTIEAHRAINE